MATDKCEIALAKCAEIQCLLVNLITMNSDQEFSEDFDHILTSAGNSMIELAKVIFKMKGLEYGCSCR